MKKEMLTKDIEAVQKLVKAVGEALKQLAETLPQESIIESKIETTRRALNDVIVECLRLRYLLGRRTKVSPNP